MIRLRAASFVLALPLAASLLVIPPAQATDSETSSPANAMAQASPLSVGEYRRLLREYQEARAAFEEQASAYWNAIAEKRRGRNAKRREHIPIALDDYVLTQPPSYTGPRRPVNPEPESEPEAKPRQVKPIPVAGDLVRAANDHFQWSPQKPVSEIEFKRAYARYAQAAGLTREQAVRVYSFETGGTGNYDVQAGIEHGGKRAISTAMGYNQLLTTNSVELLAEQGPEFVKELTAKAAGLSGVPRQVMDRKIAVLKKMVDYARSVPDDWSAHRRVRDQEDHRRIRPS